MSSTKAAKLRTKDGHSRLQSLTKTSNFVFRDDVTKDEQGLDARILFTRSDYFASENAKQCKKKMCKEILYIPTARFSRRFVWLR